MPDRVLLIGSRVDGCLIPAYLDNWTGILLDTKGKLKLKQLAEQQFRGFFSEQMDLNQQAIDALNVFLSRYEVGQDIAEDSDFWKGLITLLITYVPPFKEHFDASKTLISWVNQQNAQDPNSVIMCFSSYTAHGPIVRALLDHLGVRSEDVILRAGVEGSIEFFAGKIRGLKVPYAISYIDNDVARAKHVMKGVAEKANKSVGELCFMEGRNGFSEGELRAYYNQSGGVARGDEEGARNYTELFDSRPIRQGLDSEGFLIPNVPDPFFYRQRVNNAGAMNDYVAMLEERYPRFQEHQLWAEAQVGTAVAHVSAVHRYVELPEVVGRRSTQL